MKTRSDLSDSSVDPDLQRAICFVINILNTAEENDSFKRWKPKPCLMDIIDAGCESEIKLVALSDFSMPSAYSGSNPNTSHCYSIGATTITSRTSLQDEASLEGYTFNDKAIISKTIEIVALLLHKTSLALDTILSKNEIIHATEEIRRNFLQ